MTQQCTTLKLLLISVLALFGGIARAQGFPDWERPRNNLSLPVSEPIAIEIRVPQTQLVTASAAMNPMTAGGLTIGIAAILENADEAATAKLRQDMPVQDYGELLRNALRRNLDERQFASIKGISVYRGESANGKSIEPGDGEEQVLALRLRYYLTPRQRSLQVSLDARFGPRRTVISGGSDETSVRFSQRIIYDVLGDARMFAKPSTRAKVWADIGGSGVAALIAEGIDAVAILLASELGTSPRFGRISGKQIAWSDGSYARYGVVERTDGNRNLLRIRNGWLVSLPRTAE